METVAVTGGNGRIGKATLKKLNSRGYETINLARGKKRESISDRYLRADLLDAGNVYGSLARSGADAVIHMGTIPSPTRDPAYITFRSNVMTSFHIMEASKELELESVCIASSINAIGYSFQSDPAEIHYLPVDENHPANPKDPYALGKRVVEVVAEGFGRQDSLPRAISTIRYPRVFKTEELKKKFVGESRSLEDLKEEKRRDVTRGNRFYEKNDLFTYIQIDDAAEIAVKAVESDFSTHETFWAVAEDTTANVPTQDIVDNIYPDVEIRKEFEGFEGLISIEKAKEILSWNPNCSWRELN